MKLWKFQQLSLCADQWWSMSAVIHFKINFKTTFHALFLCIFICEIGCIFLLTCKYLICFRNFLRHSLIVHSSKHDSSDYWSWWSFSNKRYWLVFFHFRFHRIKILKSFIKAIFTKKKFCMLKVLLLNVFFLLLH